METSLTESIPNTLPLKLGLWFLNKFFLRSVEIVVKTYLELSPKRMPRKLLWKDVVSAKFELPVSLLIQTQTQYLS